MNRKKAGDRLTVLECLVVAALVLGLATTGVVAVGFELHDLFSTVRLP